MKYSRKRIDKAGRIIAAKPADALEYAEAMTVVNDWRKLHLSVLEILMGQLNALLLKNDIKPAFSSQRLKRMISIQEKLQALVGAVSLTESNSFNGGYALVLIDYNEKKLGLRHFTQEEKDIANDIYAKTESGIKREEAAVVLVAVSDIHELREAYPSYFLNAREFIAALSDFQDKCRLNGYIA